MPEQRRPRTHFSAQERAWRSKLTQIVSGYPFLRGTLQERFRVCGKPHCRCTRGEKHRALYVVLSDGKRQRQLYVPQAWEERVRKWVAHHRALKELIREVSEMYWRKVEQREE